MNDDLISRKRAIEAIDGIGWYHQNINKDMIRGAVNSRFQQAWYKMEDVYEALEGLPGEKRTSRWPILLFEKETGEWLKISSDGIYKCSVCGQTVKTSDILSYKYCHGCGAWMGE